MRKLLGNLKEKRFYNETKTEVSRHSPTSLQVYTASGEAEALVKLHLQLKQKLVLALDTI